MNDSFSTTTMFLENGCTVKGTVTKYIDWLNELVFVLCIWPRKCRKTEVLGQI